MEKEIKHAGIKLIATDVDGTLVKDSSREVSQEVIGTIQQLCGQGVLLYDRKWQAVWQHPKDVCTG